MKKLLSVIAIVGMAIPAFAQDDFGFGGGDSVLTGNDINALFGGGGNNRNNNNNNNNNIPDPESMFLQLKDLLKNKKAPLTKDQEKALQPFLESEIKEMRAGLEAQFGNRGNNRGNNNSANVIAEFFTLVSKHNTELLTTMKSDLTPDQVSLITKAEKDKKACTVMLDQFNPAQLQNRNQNFNNNNRGGGNFNLPPGFEDLVGFDGGGGGRGGNNNRGNNNNNAFFQQIPDRAFCTTAASTTAERLAPISQVLTKGKKPLTADQEKKFSGLIEQRLTLLQEEMKATDNRIGNLLNDINNQFRNNNNNNNNQNQTVNPQTLRNNIVNTIMNNLGIPNNNNNNNNRGRGNFNNNNTAGNNTGGNNNAGNNNTAAANNNAGNNNAAANNNPNNAQANNQNQNANNGNNNRGNRGNNNNNNFNNFNPQAEIRKKNEELYDKVAAKLNPDQGAIVTKYKFDQIKARGGAERYRAIMEEEKTPLTPEQLTQITNLINAQNQAVRQFAEKLAQDEISKAPSLEPPPQPPNQNGQRPNPNNINANPVAQQIVAKLMPQVSKQHALLEKTTGDTILKLLTPPQVASYKLNNL